MHSITARYIYIYNMWGLYVHTVSLCHPSTSPQMVSPSVGNTGLYCRWILSRSSVFAQSSNSNKLQKLQILNTWSYFVPSHTEPTEQTSLNSLLYQIARYKTKWLFAEKLASTAADSDNCDVTPLYSLTPESHKLIPDKILTEIWICGFFFKDTSNIMVFLRFFFD